MRRLRTLAFAVAFAGCASTGEQGVVEGLRLSAASAELEARTQALAWASEPVLRYVEGVGVRWTGYVLPDSGTWRFVYEAPGREDQLVVSVAPLGIATERRPRQYPPGLVLGDGTLEMDWIDSTTALEAIRAGTDAALPRRRDAAFSLLLIPLTPAQWIVSATADGETGRWRVDALTGDLISS